MKHNILITTLVILALIVIGLLAYIALKPDRAIAPVITEQRTVVQKSQKVEDVEQKTGQEPATLVSVDDEWNLYTNHTLGFSMKVPKYNYQSFDIGGGVLDQSADCLKDQAIIVISDDKTGRVYVGSKNVYSYDEDKCYHFDFDMFDRDLQGKPSDISGGVVISIISVENESTSINAVFAQRQGYQGCKSNNIVFEDGKVNVSSHVVRSAMENYGEEEGGCFLNWMIFAYYSTTESKLALCDLGHSSRFWGKSDSGGVQNEMFDSFKFE